MSIPRIQGFPKSRISRHEGQVFLDIDGAKDQQNVDHGCLEILYYARMKMSAWIKEAREHARLTQDQLGERIGVSKANVSAWENDRHEASFGQLQQISAITNYPLPSGSGGDLPAVNDAAIIAELSAMAEMNAIYSRASHDLRRRMLTAVRDIERLGVSAKAAAKNKT